MHRGDEDIDVRMMRILNDSGGADDLLDPVGESGDACVDTIVVWTPAAFAPAHHPGQEPATRRLLANQGATRVSLTETGNVRGAVSEILMALQNKLTMIIDKADGQYCRLIFDITWYLDVWH